MNMIPFPAWGVERETPHNLEAEQRLLGALLVNNAAYNAAAMRTLQPEHFYEPLHGRIFAGIRKTVETGGRADPVSLKTSFDADPAMHQLGGWQYMARLAGSAVSVGHADHYAKIILDLWRRRRIIALCQQASESAYAADLDVGPTEQIAALCSELDNLAVVSDSGLAHVGDAADRVLELADEASRNPYGLRGLATGLSDLDRMLGGMEQTQLIIAAGRPGMGKTALAGTVALNVASKGTPVAIFSHEMSSVQIMRRLLAMASGVPFQAIKRGSYTPDERERLVSVRDYIRSLPLFIDDAANQSPSMIRSKCRSFKRKRGLGLVIVDHMQIMRGDAERYGNRTAELTDISKGLKATAKELDVPVLALSQLSRGVEGRDDKRPLLSDLRESGSIEQDADVVLLLYREAYYWKQDNPEPDSMLPAHVTWEADFEAIKRKAEIIVGKLRDGEPGTSQVYFDGERVCFRALDQIHAPPLAA